MTHRAEKPDDLFAAPAQEQRAARVQRHIMRTFGEILQTEADLPPESLVTVSAVDTSPNLHTATVWLSVLPSERGKQVLAALKKQMYQLQGTFNRTVRLHPLPRLFLRLDTRAEDADHTERTINEVE